MCIIFTDLLGNRKLITLKDSFAENQMNSRGRWQSYIFFLSFWSFGFSVRSFDSPIFRSRRSRAEAGERVASGLCVPRAAGRDRRAGRVAPRARRRRPPRGRGSGDGAHSPRSGRCEETSFVFIKAQNSNPNWPRMCRPGRECVRTRSLATSGKKDWPHCRKPSAPRPWHGVVKVTGPPFPPGTGRRSRGPRSPEETCSRCERGRGLASPQRGVPTQQGARSRRIPADGNATSGEDSKGPQNSRKHTVTHKR